MKQGHVLEKLRFEKICWEVKDAGHRTVAFLGNEKLAVFENGKQVAVCGEKWANCRCVSVDNSRVYFPSAKRQLIRFDCETLLTETLLHEVHAVDGTPGDRQFLAVSEDGLLQSRDTTKHLKQCFPRMSYCHWRAVQVLGDYAVVAGHSSHHLLNGNRLQLWNNVFLLLLLAGLEVVNQKTPLLTDWKGTSCHSPFRLRRRRHLHAML